MHINRRKSVLWPLAAIIGCAMLFLAELLTGPAEISFHDLVQVIIGKQTGIPQNSLIILESRLPRALTAFFAGSGLALAGWLMQTLFRNPLASPSVLGISSGASLSVALLLLGGTLFGSAAAFFPSPFIIAGAAMTGALIVLLIITAVSMRLHHSASLLLFGILLGHFVSAIEQVLQHRSEAAALRSFVVWGLGRFSDAEVSVALGMGAVIVCCSVVISLLTPSLNLLLLGDAYSQSMGLNVRRIRWLIIVITGIIAGVITAFCGPIAFIGLAVPHLCRILLGTSDHRKLMWFVVTLGAFTGLFSDLCSRHLEIPLNAVTSLIGAPVVLSIILQSGHQRSVL